MIRAAWQHVRHRTAIELSCGSIPPRNFARSTTIVALHVEAIEHMLDQASVVRQVAGPSTHGGIHCTDTERELLVVHTPGLYLGISIGHLTTGSFLTRSNCSTTVRQPAPSITVTGPSFPKAICSGKSLIGVGLLIETEESMRRNAAEIELVFRSANTESIAQGLPEGRAPLALERIGVSGFAGYVPLA